MIQYVHGDIFESEAQTIVNPVNTVGVMGKGLALSFKEKYPEMFKNYREICMKGLFNPGQLMLFSLLGSLGSPFSYKDSLEK